MDKLNSKRVAWAIFVFSGLVASACYGHGERAVAPSSTMLNPETPAVTSPYEPAFKAMLPRVMKSDAEPDRLTRCLNYPDPPNFHWPRKVVVAYCHREFDKYITLQEVAAMLQRKQVMKVQAIFAGYQKEQRSGRRPDALDIALFDVFGDSSKLARDTADIWLSASPHSALALTASGIQYAQAASEARGNRYYSETPRENIIRMAELNAKADIDLKKALAIDSRLITAIGQEANISMRQRGRDETLAWIHRGMSLYPDNWYLHDTNGANAEMRWGGSEGEQKDAVAYALRNASRNPALAVEAGRIDYDLKTCSCSHDDELSMHDYEAIAANAPVLDALRGAGSRAVEGHNWSLGVVYLSELMRFSWASEPDSHVNRGIALTFLGDFDAAQRDADAALAVLPNDKDALQLNKMIPAFRAESESIKAEAQRSR